MEKGKVSIIVPCYNKEQYLLDTLNSVLSQTYNNWECIIVDDGSIDNSYSIAKEYCRKNNHFFVIRQDNKGVSVARNTGIYHSDGEFVLPLDADDMIAPSFLEKAIRRFCEVPETKLVYSMVRCFGDSNEIYNLPPFDYQQFLKQNLICCTALFRRSDYDLTHGYSSTMLYGLEDWDFWLSLLSENDIVYRMEEELFFYRMIDHSRTEETVKHLSEMEKQIFLNHKDKYAKSSSDWIVLNRHIRELECELLATRTELSKTRHSRAFVIGKFLLKPYIFLMEHFADFGFHK